MCPSVFASDVSDILEVILAEVTPIEGRRLVLRERAESDGEELCVVDFESPYDRQEVRTCLGKTLYAAVICFGYWLLKRDPTLNSLSEPWDMLYELKEFHYIRRDRPGLFVLCIPACLPRLKRDNWLPVDLFRLLVSYL